MEHPSSNRLHIAAAIGVAVVLIERTWRGVDVGGHAAGFGFVIAAAVLVLLAMAVTAPEGLRLLRRHLELLVPLGVVTFLDATLGWLASLPGLSDLLTASTEVKLVVMPLRVSAMFIAGILLWAGYGAWMTTLVLRVTREGDADPACAGVGLRRWFFRVLGLGAICRLSVGAGSGVVLAVGMAAMPVVAPVLIGLLVLLVNFATAALLLAALDERLGFIEGLVEGVRRSFSGLRRWLAPVVAQLLLLGFVTVIVVPNRASWSVNPLLWVGGYENRCRWYSKLMEMLEIPEAPVAETALALLFGMLAVAVKITIAARLGGRGAGPEPAGVTEEPAPLPGDPPEDHMRGTEHAG